MAEIEANAWSDDADTALLEHVRQRAAQLPSWDALANQAKTILLEKRTVLDHDSRDKLRQAVAILQENRAVKSQKQLFSVLKEISAKTELKFSNTSANVAFISSDSFYVEIQCSANAGDNVTEQFSLDKVLIVHPHQDVEICEEFKRTIEHCDWAQVELHLRKLIAFYPSKAGSSVKADAFVSMCALEKDLISVGKKSLFDEKDIVSSANTAQIGFVSPRREGNACRVLFYLSPYDLLKDGKKLSITSESDLLSQSIGVYFDLTTLARPTDTLLPTTPLHGENGSFRQLDNTCGKMLPCCFELKLSRKLIISADSLRRITAATGLEQLSLETGNYFTLFRKVNAHAVTNTVEFHVAVPGERHKYILDDHCGRRWDNSMLIDRLLISSGEQLLHILPILRQHLLFTLLLESFVRKPLPHAPSKTVEVRCPSVAKIQLVCEPSATDGEKAVDDMITMNINLETGCSDMPVSVSSLRSVDFTQNNFMQRLTDVLALTWSLPILVKELDKLLRQLSP